MYSEAFYEKDKWFGNLFGTADEKAAEYGYTSFWLLKNGDEKITGLPSYSELWAATLFRHYG